jgi:hypothetical protein
MTGGTAVASCGGSFYETCCNGELRDGRPNGQTGDEQAHVMRWDADAQYGGSVYNDCMKGSTQKTSLCSIVNCPSYPTDALFQ